MTDPALQRPIPPPLDDNLLLKRHLDGDARAFPLLIEQHGGLVYGLLGRCGLTGPERDDLFQEVWLRVHRAAGSYQPSRPLRPWLATIAMNTARSHISRRKDPVPGEPPEQPAKSPTGAQVAEGRELADWLRDQLDRLPDAERKAVHLVCVEGLAQADVAHILGLPVNTVKTHLRRGRVALADALARRRAAEARELSR